ncbi:MAG: ATP-binding cassette domain-containing protein, partial [Actinobacteria bacterium]|nr:ATP-binding cassette domain-containing protein [Actinomycetota bacterium]
MDNNKKEILKIENISVNYGPIAALQEVSLNIYEGEIVVLLGANGSGKSTLLNAILGIVPCKKGHIFFQGEEITHKATNNRVSSGICLLPESHGIIPSNFFDN